MVERNEELFIAAFIPHGHHIGVAQIARWMTNDLTIHAVRGPGIGNLAVVDPAAVGRKITGRTDQMHRPIAQLNSPQPSAIVGGQVVIAIGRICIGLPGIGGHSIRSRGGQHEDVIGVRPPHGTVSATEEEGAIILGGEVPVRCPHWGRHITIPAIDRDEIPNPLTVILNTMV